MCLDKNMYDVVPWHRWTRKHVLNTCSAPHSLDVVVTGCFHHAPVPDTNELYDRQPPWIKKNGTAYQLMGGTYLLPQYLHPHLPLYLHKDMYDVISWHGWARRHDLNTCQCCSVRWRSLYRLCPQCICTWQKHMFRLTTSVNTIERGSALADE